jgi:hypothetical protein
MSYYKRKALRLQVLSQAFLLTTATLFMAVPAAPAHAHRAIETNIFHPGSAYNVASLKSFQESLGITFHSAKWYQDWSHPIDPFVPNGFRANGFLPELTWEPMINGVGIADSAITNGSYNSYLSQNARVVKNLGYPIRISFAPEMNGDWTPWAIGKHGNTAESHKAAFRHVVQMFRNEGVSNVQWIWAPNVYTPGALTPFSSMYPGDAYVDILGLDGYNWGTSRPWTAWQSFSTVYTSSYRDLIAISNRPIVITEIASTELGGDKAAWITDMYATIRANFPHIQGFTWFNENKETDWRITSSPAARDAFINGFKGVGTPSSPSPTPSPTISPTPSPTPKTIPRKPKQTQLSARTLSYAEPLTAVESAELGDTDEQMYTTQLLEETNMTTQEVDPLLPQIEPVAAEESIAETPENRLSTSVVASGAALLIALALYAVLRRARHS